MPGSTVAQSVARTARVRMPAWSAPAVLAWGMGFALVAYLAFSNGGYDTVVRNQVGVAVWWLVLVGALAAVLPGRIPRAGWVAVGLLGAFVLWTVLSTGWSESAERAWGGAGKVATHAGVLAVGRAAPRRAAARHTLNGVACAIGVVGVLTLLSRLHPTWFPANDQGTFLDNTSPLAYPLNYWNALAALMVVGVPLMLAVAAGARR